MRIAIIGSGISGLVAAYKLHDRHEITVFEANDYIGGHTNTVSVERDGEQHSVDTGFIVFNDRTYPNFCELLDELGVASQPTSMSFSVHCDRTGLEYNGTSLNGLFCQRLNLFRPRFHKMLADIMRFNRESVGLLADPECTVTVSDYLHDNDYSQQFAEHYLLPMGSAIWSCPTGTFEKFPMRFIVEFYQNHGLLSIRNRPTWRVIRGGSAEYVKPLVAGFRNHIRLNSPIERVVRFTDHVVVHPAGKNPESFDEVIFACHSDQALRILGADVTKPEQEILSSIPYEPNTAVLHTDRSVLPRRRRAWASWNYHIPEKTTAKATVTYNMNILQNIESRNVFCVTLNGDEGIDEGKILARFRYSHPIFTIDRAVAQSRHHELLRTNRTSFCGAYWGNGFHEDGVNSALAVCDAYQHTMTAIPKEVPAHA